MTTLTMKKQIPIMTFNEYIISRYNEMDIIDFMEFIALQSKRNTIPKSYKTEKYKIKNCQVSIYYKYPYLFSESEMINGICALILESIDKNEYPYFYEEVGFKNLPGLVKVIEKLLSEDEYK